MKKFTIGIFVFFVSMLSAESGKREMGDFVKDIPIPELRIRIPEIQKESFRNRIGFYSLVGGFFPLQQAEIHFYSGEHPDISPETRSLLFETWKLGGTNSLPGKSFLETLEFLGADLEWQTEYEKSILKLSYLERDEEVVLGVIREWLLTPKLEKENLEIVRGQIRERILRRDDHFANLGIRKTKERFYEGHLRGRSESLESLDRVSLKDLELCYRRILGAEQIKVLFSGNSREAENRKFWFETLSKTDPFRGAIYEDLNYENWKVKFRSSDPRIHLIDKNTNQAIVVMTGIMPPHNHKDFYAIQVLNYILGGGGFNSYFMTEIRNNRGLAYSTTSYIVFEKTHGIFLAYSMTKIESVPEVFRLMQSILSPDTIYQITESELKRAQNAIVNQFVFLFENRASILRNQVRFEDHNMPSDYLTIYRDHILKVTLEDLRRVGKEYFNPIHLRTVIVAPSHLEKELKTKDISVQVIAP